MRADCKNEVIRFLNGTKKKLNVVVMPDFFYDRLINLEYDAASFSSSIMDITERKGGSIDGVVQTDIRGGNAVNTASALASLGVNVTVIVCTNKLGLQQLKFYLGKQHVDLSYVKIAEKASLTTAMEFEVETGKANVMLRDLGALANFGPSNLTERDYALIDSANYVCVFNWAGTKRYGTALAEKVFCRVKTQGRGKTYYDTADPNPNRDKIPKLMQKVLKTSQVDILSLNENEAICYAAMLNSEIYRNKKKRRFDEMAIEAARVLAKHLPARIDLHTTFFSATITKKTEVDVPTFKIKPLRATGAGDAWNAGNILGDANDLSDECRLVLANAVSAYYLTDLYGAHPTRQKLVKFIENSALNSPVES